MRRPLQPRVIAALALTVLAGATPALAQPRDNPVTVRGFATFGQITFQARESFDALFDTHQAPIVGGGVQVLLPRGIYVDVAAARATRTGERAFVGPNREVFRLGIPLEVTITPIEITGGWRYRRWTRVVPYGGAGYSSYHYRETSEFANAEEDVDDRFGGFHVVGGVEYQALRWIALGGEFAWSSIPDALGESGVSAVFDEDNLGGATIRFKVIVGR